jgi:hypothetical protein
MLIACRYLSRSVAIVVLCSSLAAAAEEKLSDDERRYLSMLIQCRDVQANYIQRSITRLQARHAKFKPSANDVAQRSKPTEATREPVDRGSADSIQPKHLEGSTKSRRDTLFDDATRDDIDIQFERWQLAEIQTGLTLPEWPYLRLLRPISYYGHLPKNIVHVIEVMGPSDMVIHWPPGRSRRIWLHGIPTKGVEDDQNLVVHGIFLVDGTERYRTSPSAQETLTKVRLLVVDEQKVLGAYRARLESLKDWESAHGPLPAVKPTFGTGPIPPEYAARRRYFGLLTNSRALIKAGMRDAGRAKLQRIIQEVPGTKIAIEAQQELDALPPH